MWIAFCIQILGMWRHSLGFSNLSMPQTFLVNKLHVAMREMEREDQIKVILVLSTDDLATAVSG